MQQIQLKHPKRAKQSFMITTKLIIFCRKLTHQTLVILNVMMKIMEFLNRK